MGLPEVTWLSQVTWILKSINKIAIYLILFKIREFGHDIAQNLVIYLIVYSGREFAAEFAADFSRNYCLKV